MIDPGHGQFEAHHPIGTKPRLALALAPRGPGDDRDLAVELTQAGACESYAPARPYCRSARGSSPRFSSRSDQEGRDRQQMQEQFRGRHTITILSRP